MHITTKYFGPLDYEREDIVYMDRGLFGFEEMKEYLLINMRPDSQTLMCLQSVQDENLAFILMNPYQLVSDYHPILSEEDKSAMELTEDSSVIYYSVCVIHDTAADCTVNLKCPIIINTENRHGRQVILENEKYAMRHTLKSLASDSKEG